MKLECKNTDVANVLRLPEVIKLTGLSRSSIYAFMSDDEKFPRSIRLGKRSVGWLEREISAWIESRAASRKEASQSDMYAILAELEKLEPSDLAALEPRFRKFYPVIKAKLDQGVKRKETIALLAKHGIEVHHMQFEALMKTIEVERRGDAEEVGVKR